PQRRRRRDGGAGDEGEAAVPVHAHDLPEDGGVSAQGALARRRELRPTRQSLGNGFPSGESPPHPSLSPRERGERAERGWRGHVSRAYPELGEGGDSISRKRDLAQQTMASDQEAVPPAGLSPGPGHNKSPAPQKDEVVWTFWQKKR